MAITLKQIPGFADVADSNFAAEQYAIGLNFQRTIENAKFGVVRPEVFYGRYINGNTVSLPVSDVDGYTYTREECQYIYHFAMTGSAAAGSNGTPSQSGAIRYLAADIDQTTGAVTTYVEYLVGNGSAPTISNDGTLDVFTVATRRRTSLTVKVSPQYVPVLDTELTEDAAITDSIMQRINDNAKFAALRSEIIYMGEFVDGGTVPLPVSPADGYTYSRGELRMFPMWRWTTQGDSLTDPTNSNYKQINNLLSEVDDNTGLVTLRVSYYNSVNYVSTNGRVAVFAFCQRNISSLGAGTVDFVDLDTSFLTAGRFARADVLQRIVRNTRFAMLRREFFYTNYHNGDYVALPVSPVDGYQYSREELMYVCEYIDTSNPATAPRMYSWNCTVNQSTGQVISNITRVPNGGAAVPTNDGLLRVFTVARRGHEAADSAVYDGSTGGSGTNDATALQNGGFDQWTIASNHTADGWSVSQQNGAGYAQQATGLISGYAQRLGIGASSTAQSAPSVYPATHEAAVISSSVRTVPGTPYYLSWVQKPSAALAGGLTCTVFMYSAAGDILYFTLSIDTTAIPAGLSQVAAWFVMPKMGDTTVQTNAAANGATYGSNAPILDPNTQQAATLDFQPTSIRVEFYFNGPVQSYVDIDEVTLLNQVDPSIGQVAQRGSNSIAFFPALTWQVTDTTFTPAPCPVINRADGTTTTPNGTPPTVTGLTPATSYVWYPYLDELTQTLRAVGGDSGTPNLLQSAASQAFYETWYNIGHLPLAATPITITTQATPSGGGSAPPSGGSGGGGTGSGGYGGGGDEPRPVETV